MFALLILYLNERKKSKCYKALFKEVSNRTLDLYEEALLLLDDCEDVGITIDEIDELRAELSDTRLVVDKI